jgi:thimet oligopeptidase
MCFGLPNYASVTPDDLSHVCAAAIETCDTTVAAIVAVPPGVRTFENTMLALEEAQQALADAKEAWTFLVHVAVADAVRDHARTWRQRLDRHAIGLRFDERLHGAVGEFAETAEAKALTGENARFLAHTLREHRRHGSGLPADQRRRLRYLLEELTRLAAEFGQAVADHDDAILVERADLDGLPESYVDGLTRSAGSYRVSLAYPDSQPFMANARSTHWRRELQHKQLRKGGLGNVGRLERAISVRTEIAALLGCKSWADYVIEARMAKSPAAVGEFLDTLRDAAAARAPEDVALLAEANHAAGSAREYESWDLQFALNNLQRTRYQVDEFEVAQYFSLDTCLAGLFGLVEELFGVRCVAKENAPRWHPEVRAYDLVDSGGTTPFARCYLDLFPRRGKYTHGATMALRSGRRLADGSYQRPVAAVVANLGQPAPGAPSLLRHAEVVTLFHEFGHVLHKTLTRVERARFSGSATERDFSEVPAKILEQWCWDPVVLPRFARHHATGAPLPAALLDRMIAAKRAAPAIRLLNQLFYASLDFAYHSPGFCGDSTATLRDVYQHHLIDYPDGTYAQAGLLHLFQGYDFGMYSYLWSTALSEDIYTKFRRAGSIDPATGAAYRRLILERGSAADADVLVGDFLGREPNIGALLENLGI